MALLAKLQRAYDKALSDRKKKLLTAQQYQEKKKAIFDKQAVHEKKLEESRLEREAEKAGIKLAKKIARAEAKEKARTYVVSFPIYRDITVKAKGKGKKKKAERSYRDKNEVVKDGYGTFKIIRKSRESDADFEQRINGMKKQQIIGLNTDYSTESDETWTRYAAGGHSVSSGGGSGTAMGRAKPYDYEFSNFASIVDDGNCVPESLAKLYPKWSLERIEKEMGGPGLKEAEDVYDWCVRHDITCLGCEEDFTIITMANGAECYYVSRNRNHTRTPPLYFVRKDNHFYIIDKSKGQSIMKNRFNSIQKKKDETPVPRTTIAEDVIEYNAENTHTIVSSRHVIDALIREYIDTTRKVPAVKFEARVEDDKGTLRIKSFMYGKNNFVSVNKHYELVSYVLEKIGGKADSMRELATRIFAMTNPAFPKSCMNSVVMDIFLKWKDRQHIGAFYEQDEWDTVEGDEQTHDMNKQYSSAMHGMTRPWLIFNRFSFPRPYSGGVKDAMYYIETENTMPCKGNGWYPALMLECLLEENIPHTVLYEIVAAETLPADTFKGFVEKAMALVPDSITQEKGRHFSFKHITNTLCGSLNIHKKTFAQGKITANRNDTYERCMTTDGLFYELSNDITACATIKQELVEENNMPMYAQILTWASIQLWKGMKHMKTHDATIRSYNTDSITFKSPQPIELLSNNYLGGWKLEETKPIENMIEPVCRIMRYTLQQVCWENELREEMFDGADAIVEKMKGGCFLDAPAGFGKSYMGRKFIEAVGEESCLIVAFTNVAANNIGGKTIHRSLHIIEDGDTTTHDIETALRGKTYLILDEISQVPAKLYRVVEVACKFNIRIILAGDLSQILPVGEVNVSGQAELIRLISKTRIELTVYRRGDMYLLEKLTQVRNRVAIDFDQGEKGTLHFCFTKKQRDYINNREMAKRTTGYITLPKNSNISKVYVGMPVRSCKTRDGKWLNNQRWKVVSVHMNSIEVMNDEKAMSVDTDDFIHNFVPAYAMTIHSSQGLTISEPYTLWIENKIAFSDDEKWRMIYTALSRATTHEQIGIVYV